MHLRDVMVLPASGGKDDIGLLRESCDHVVDIFRHHLPKKYELGGLRRLVINLGLGDADDGRQYYDGGDGVGYYAAPRFDMESYFARPSKEQEEIILEVVADALLDLARRFDVPTEPLEISINRVKESGFKLDTPLACSKSHPTRKLRVVVIRRYAPGGVFVLYEIKDKDGRVLHSDEIVSGAWTVAVNYDFRRSRWNGHTLEILDGSGKVTAYVPCGAYIAP